jgi:uncharacterized protein
MLHLVRRAIEVKASPRLREARELRLVDCELKFAEKKSPDDPVSFSGYASKWGGVDAYGDTVVKGAFSKALKARMPMMFMSHNPNRVIGKWTDAGEDSKGLHVKGELTPGHSDAADTAASLKHGALSGLSIGGWTTDSEPTDNGRNIREFDLYEISPTAMPADDDARIDLSTVKSMIDACESPADFEGLLREAGFSKANATSFVARMRRTLRGEPGGDLDAAKTRELLEAMRGFNFPTSLTG